MGDVGNSYSVKLFVPDIKNVGEGYQVTDFLFHSDYQCSVVTSMNGTGTIEFLQQISYADVVVEDGKTPFTFCINFLNIKVKDVFFSGTAT